LVKVRERWGLRGKIYEELEEALRRLTCNPDDTARCT
jgi:hypothetical protein